MYYNSIYSQLFNFIPRYRFEKIVKKLADAFENKAFADILKMNLKLTQEVLMCRIFNDKSNQQRVIGAIPCMSMVNNMLFYKLFPFDKLDYGMFLRQEDMKIK